MDLVRNWFNTRLSRRELLTLFIVGLAPLKTSFSAQSETPEDGQVVEAFIDTLIPADDITPSASALGVHLEIISYTKTDIAYGRLIQLGCRWLNHQSDGDFTRLPGPQRIQILQWMEHADDHTLPALFFNRIRYQAMAYYYSQPASWKDLGLQHPPQPLGYMDYRS